MKNIDIHRHVRGESQYLDDVPLHSGTLFAAAFASPVAHGHILSLDLEEALASPGVVRILTYRDIPGINQIGGIVPDEPLLAEDTLHFAGMPVALVLAETAAGAYAATHKIKLETSPLPVVTDPRLAKENGDLLVPPRRFRMGDPASVRGSCTTLTAGRADTNGQEHLYIETQGAYSFPAEGGSIRVVSSTQGPTAVQRHVAAVLGLGMHQVEVEVTRLGGGFGGKEDQATVWAALCCLGTYHTRRPVKYSLHRLEDMRMTGKRNPYTSDFQIGIGQDLKILSIEATYYQNAGASADLSPAVLERTLFHATNSYYVPHTDTTAYCCKTHLPPNTAFRGFGGPQGMFVMEAAIHAAARKLGVPAWEIQSRNLICSGEEFPYGQRAESEARACWDEAFRRFKADEWIARTEEFNRHSVRFKKGISFMPVCFGISFTKTPMNQGRALVHVYTDGSVGVSTGAVEMGQGVNTKMLQVAAGCFTLDPGRVRIFSTNTYRIANTSPSAASATADLNGKAVEMACKALKERILSAASGASQNLQLSEGRICDDSGRLVMSWEEAVQLCYQKRLSLSEHAHYTPPGLHFDTRTEKGHPFAYHVYGTAITEVTVDCLLGTYETNAVRVVHDFGKSMNEDVDLGQIEGGIVQGIGWMTMEEIVYDAAGRLRSNALSTYKIPDLYSVPGEIEIHALETSRPNLAVLQSKAVGEPPLMYGIGTYFALYNAVMAANPDTTLPYDAPMTPEKILEGLFPAHNKGIVLHRSGKTTEASPGGAAEITT